jgi:hypothetical protein|tara:strand:- start:891 stop:1058 length:168 start_codon:yes stop_codon:yes gene_type:complete
MSIYRSPLEDDEGVFKIESDLGKCPKCGKVGCTCGPDCSCSQNSEQKKLIQSFEE